MCGCSHARRATATAPAFHDEGLQQLVKLGLVHRMTPPQHARRSCAAQRVKDSLIHHVCMRCLVPGRLRGDVLSECPSGCPGGVDSSAAASSMHVAMAPRTAAITWSGAVADRSMSQSSPLSPLAASAMALAPAGALVTTAGTPAPAPEPLRRSSEPDASAVGNEWRAAGAVPMARTAWLPLSATNKVSVEAWYASPHGNENWALVAGPPWQPDSDDPANSSTVSVSAQALRHVPETVVQQQGHNTYPAG